MRKLSILVSAIAVFGTLSACSSEESASSSSAIQGEPAFLELVDDARLAMRDGNLAEAGRMYDQAREIDPENPGLWVDISRLRFRGGEHLTAIEAADYALLLNPEYAPALLLRAQLVRDANGLAESLVWFEAAATADPRNPEVLAEYAATLGDLGRYSDMLTVVRELAEFAPDFGQVHYLQAVLAARGGDPVLASNLLARSGQSADGVPSAMMLAAIVEMQQGNFDTAVETLDELAQRQPSNMRVNELLARALWLGGRDRELVDRFSARASRPEASAYLVMIVGRSLERLGERDRAIPFIERALTTSAQTPSDERIVLETGGSLPAATAQLRDLVRSGNAAGAQRAARASLDRVPGSGDFHSLAGDAALAGGDSRRALELYEVAARVRRSWPLTRKIIVAYRGIGDDVAADVVLSRYVAGDPHNTDALLLLAQDSAEREDWLRVALLLDNAIELGVGNDLEVLALRADAARGLERDDEAARFDAMRSELIPGNFVVR